MGRDVNPFLFLCPATCMDLDVGRLNQGVDKRGELWYNIGVIRVATYRRT